MDVQEQGHAGVRRLPPRNSGYAGSPHHLCHRHQEKPNKRQEEGGEQDEQEEAEGGGPCVLMSTC